MLNEVNTILCIIILALGYAGYRKRKEALPIYLSIAFGMFAMTHIITLEGFAAAWMNFVITLRVLAYFMIIFALYRVATE